MTMIKDCRHIQDGEPAYALSTVMVIGYDEPAWPPKQRDSYALTFNVCRSCALRLTALATRMVTPREVKP